MTLFQAVTDSLDIPSALKATLKKLDQGFAKKYPDKCETVGSTACVCYIEGSTVYVANVGDSRCVGGKRKPGGYHETVALSKDHNTDNEKEVAAVVARSGEKEAVRYFPGERGGPKRVDGVLMVTRAIGDFALKPKYITCEAEVRTMSLSEGDFVVVASDGVYDHLSSEEVSRVAFESVWFRMVIGICNISEASPFYSPFRNAGSASGISHGTRP